MDIHTTRAVIREARAMAPEAPARERVRHAVEKTRGTPVLATPPIADHESMPITSGGEVIGRVDTSYVLLGNTALAVIRPRVQRMPREDVAAMLQKFCEQTGIWPQRA